MDAARQYNVPAMKQRIRTEKRKRLVHTTLRGASVVSR